MRTVKFVFSVLLASIAGTVAFCILGIPSSIFLFAGGAFPTALAAPTFVVFPLVHFFLNRRGLNDIYQYMAGGVIASLAILIYFYQGRLIRSFPPDAFFYMLWLSSVWGLVTGWVFWELYVRPRGPRSETVWGKVSSRLPKLRR